MNLGTVWKTYRNTSASLEVDLVLRRAILISYSSWKQRNSNLCVSIKPSQPQTVQAINHKQRNLEHQMNIRWYKNSVFSLSFSLLNTPFPYYEKKRNWKSNNENTPTQHRVYVAYCHCLFLPWAWHSSAPACFTKDRSICSFPLSQFTGQNNMLIFIALMHRTDYYAHFHWLKSPDRLIYSFIKP